MKLLLNARTKFICGLLLVGLSIFLPAGIIRYTGGWLLARADYFRFLPTIFIVRLKDEEDLRVAQGQHQACPP